MKIGIVGLPNAGKSTIFNALTGAGAACAAYAFTTVEPNVGVACVNDERVSEIARLLNLAKTVYGSIRFVDIAGLVEGASRGEGLGNQFLSEIRGTDALLHVVRGFEDINVAQPREGLGPAESVELVELELILSDLEILERRLEKNAKKAKSGLAEARQEAAVLEKIEAGLKKNIPLRMQEFRPEERKLISGFGLLTGKPVLYVFNVDESWKKNAGLYEGLKETLKARGGLEVVLMDGKLESELSGMDGEERRLFLEDEGFTAAGLEQICTAALRLLDLLTFFTTESNECRAWLIPRGSTAAEAAAKIHNDMAEGFIKAEIVAYEDLVKYGCPAAAREAGRYLIEGRDYAVRDGDIILFKFRG